MGRVRLLLEREEGFHEEELVTQKACLTWKKKKLIPHLEHESGLIVLSPHSKDYLEKNPSSLCKTKMPHPLDTYVYPCPVLVGLKEGDEWVDLDEGRLRSICERLEEVQKTAPALYDVPAMPFNAGGEEKEEDYSSEEDFDKSEDENEEEEVWDSDDVPAEELLEGAKDIE